MKSPKSECRTHLFTGKLVSKKNKRIAFRGMIDTLQAEFLLVQAFSINTGKEYYSECLFELIEFLRKIMAAEVKNESFKFDGFFGLSAEEIQRQSCNIDECFGIEELPLPSAKMNPLALKINYLRTKTREGELLTIRTFGGLFGRRDDLIAAMNFLSTALWWLYCKNISLK